MTDKEFDISNVVRILCSLNQRGDDLYYSDQVKVSVAYSQYSEVLNKYNEWFCKKPAGNMYPYSGYYFDTKDEQSDD